MALLVLPPLWNLTTSPDWRASPRFDGDAYRTSDLDIVLQALDDTGVAAVLATFQRWSGGDADEATMVALLTERGFTYRLAEFTDLAASLGFEGRWIDVDAAALASLKKPFVAHLEDGGGRFVIVRAVALDHVYVADPVRGQALYPWKRFEATWTGRAFAFPEPPPQPATW